MINLNSSKPKRSSSRRKGDQYQDLMALRLALELYIEKKDFKLYMEYDTKGNLDDVVVFLENKILAYQIKYSVDPHASYKMIDFTDKEDPNNKRIFIKKFSDGWKDLKINYPNKEIKIYLTTNYSVENEINEIIDNQGFFIEKFIENKKRKKVRVNRNKLKDSCQLEEEEFIEFLRSFQFQFKEKNILNLIQYIQENLINTKLGIYDNSIYNILRVNFENYAIHRRDSIDSDFFKKIFEKETTKYLLHQVFEIDEDSFIEREVFNEDLKKIIQNTSGDYIIITGLPGSGKSTTLTRYIDQLRNLTEFEVVKYYCFVDINDNFQNLRLQAKTLRANLLDQIQEIFSEILDRRYDYTEQNFSYVLSKVGKYFEENKKKLLIFLDGLDHAEKMATEIQESLINSLPRSIPKGIAIIVGTQELHNWPIFLRAIKENPDQSIELPLFNLNETQDYLQKKFGENLLKERDLQELFRISEGLPIYLRYISELIKTFETFEEVINNLSPIINGEIKYYYDFLWSEFEQFGKGNVRHLCGVLACLRFQVKTEKLVNFQEVLNLPTFHDCFNLIKHLIKINNNFVSIFHNSFREYVLSQFDENHLRQINIGISNHLKNLELSDEWFSFMFDYAYQVGDYQYVLEKITNEFVDSALYNFRSEEDIGKAIFWAIKSAKKKKDLISLSRLATLKTITRQRVEYHMNWTLLSKVLLTLGEHNRVLKYTYSINQNKWLINISLALNLIIQLVKRDFKYLSKDLFQIFTETISFKKFEKIENFIKYCKCLGIHSNSIKDELFYLKGCKIKLNHLEENLINNPENNFPYIEAYINSLIKFHEKPYWSLIKDIENGDLNELIQIYIIRSLAKNEDFDLLKEELQYYISKYNINFNSELTYYMALTKFPIVELEKEVKDLNEIDLLISNQIKYSDRGLDLYRRKFWTLCYINNKKTIDELKSFLESNRSWWHDYLLYLIKAGEFFGHYLRDSDEDVYNLAIEAIDILSNIKPARGEAIWNLIRACRNELRISLYNLTKVIVENYPLKLTEWFNKIKLLQLSEMWTKRVSLGELWDTYIFELLIYQKLSKIQSIRRSVMGFLEICEKNIIKSTMIKGGNRVEHFFLLALICARCGFEDKSRELLNEGIKSTLIYGYRKDMTLYQLIKIMSILNKYDPSPSLSRCADLIELIDWMPHLTDGSETRVFPYYIFKEITKNDVKVALKVLRIFNQNKPRWQMQDCLEYLIKKINDGDPEIMWALTDLFTNEYSEDGRYSRQIFDSKQKLVKNLEEKGDDGVFNDFKNRLYHFVKTKINPEDWPKLDFKYFKIDHPEIIEEKNNRNDHNLEYFLNGNELKKEEIKDKLRISFKKYKEVINTLKIENENFYIPSEFIDILKNYILNTDKLENLGEIKEFINNNESLSLQGELAEKLYELGEITYALDYYEKAYLDSFGFFDWNTRDKKFLQIIKNHNFNRAKSLVIKKVYNILRDYSGFQVPLLIVSALDIFEDKGSILKLYEDYLAHTKSLFYHLPIKNDYKWIKTYISDSEDFHQLAIDFLTDELKTIEIDFSRRLLDVYRNLCLNRPELLFPYVFLKLSESTGLLKERLIQIIYMISFEKPANLYPYIEQLERELNTDSFTIKMMVIRVIKNIQKEIVLNEIILKKIDNLQYKLTSNDELVKIKIPTIEPSNEFNDYFQKYFSLLDKLKGCCNVLNISLEYFIHLIEVSKDWNIEEENRRLEMDWRGKVHAQGFPYIAIRTHFDYKVLKVINQIINNLLEKNPIRKNQFESLWRILQLVDFEYKFSDIKPRPKDIEQPIIENKLSWFNELNNLDGKIKLESNLDKWITIFEFKCYEKDQGLSERYKASLIQTSFLIKTGNTSLVEENILDMNLLDHNENITLEQAKKHIKKDKFKINKNFQSLPILIKKPNHFPFFGYRSVVSLPKYIIEKYNLKFKTNLNLYIANSEVVKLEEWQEGYVSNSYSRNLKFYGTRLLINRELLERIFQDYDVNLCKEFHEARLFFRSIFDRNETERKEGLYFEILM